MRLTRPLHVLGYVLLGVIALPEVLSWSHGSAHGPAWIGAFLVFAAAYTVGATAPGEGARRRLVGALLVQAVAVLVMAATAPCVFGCLSLVILAWQVASLFSPAVTVGWLGAQTLVMALCLGRGERTIDTLFTAAEMLGFQSFAALAVAIADREHAARRTLGRVNAELRSTRALLQETSRADERMRIAREVHDLLGHDLTALGLQLEVARNLTEGRAHEHVAKARAMSDRLLEEVRGVVGTLRAEGGVDLGGALRALVQSLPGLTVHLAIDEPFVVADGARAHCLLRCVQEIVTNTLRHAGATQLWLCLRRDGAGGITVEATDDGRAAARPVRPGHGLAGMRERLEQMGGSLRIEASPARALALQAWLPAGGGAS